MSHGCDPAACAATAPVSSPLTANATPAARMNTRRTQPSRRRPPISQHFRSALLRVSVMYAVTSEHPLTIRRRQYSKYDIHKQLKVGEQRPQEALRRQDLRTRLPAWTDRP